MIHLRGSSLLVLKMIRVIYQGRVDIAVHCRLLAGLGPSLKRLIEAKVGDSS